MLDVCPFVWQTSLWTHLLGVSYVATTFIAIWWHHQWGSFNVCQCSVASFYASNMLSQAVTCNCAMQQIVWVE